VRARSAACSTRSRRREAIRRLLTPPARLHRMKRSREQSPRSSWMAPRQEFSLLRASGREYFSPTSYYGVRSARAAMTPGARPADERSGGAVASRAPPCYNRSPEAKPGKPFTRALFWRIMGFESVQYIRRVARAVTVFSTVHLMRHRPERRRTQKNWLNRRRRYIFQGICGVYTGETRADEERRDTAWRGEIVGQNAAAFCPVSLG